MIPQNVSDFNTEFLIFCAQVKDGVTFPTIEILNETMDEIEASAKALNQPFVLDRAHYIAQWSSLGEEEVENDEHEVSEAEGDYVEDESSESETDDEDEE